MSTSPLLSTSPQPPANEVVALAKKITRNCKTDEQKVEALLEWLMPGRNIRFGGPIMGSRYGVKQTLDQGFGHCWDFSDLFVTLCRAAGVQARQVAGWLYGCGGAGLAVVVGRERR